MKNIFTLFATFIFLVAGSCVYGQARIVSTNGPYMVMNGGVYLVVENTNANALTPSSGAPDLNLVSEAEDNIVKWFMGSSLTTGTNYQVPFSNTSGEYTRAIFTFPNAASTGTTGNNFYVQFSTYGTPSTNLPLPSEVNHLTNLNVASATPGVQGNTANDLNTVDRFWFIEMFDFSVRPEPQLRLSPAPSEYAAPNTITANSIMMQRFNPTAGTQGQWADWLSPATVINAAFTTGNVQIPGAEFYKTWTLTSFSEPLSVELVNFDAQCENNRASIKWSTASEQNSDYFRVERSSDGEFWETIEEVDAAGNSSSLINYVAYDDNAKTGLNYYQVVEVDVDGVESVHGPVSTNCGSDVFEIVNVISDYTFNGELNITLNASEDKLSDIRIFDLAGKMVFEQNNELIQEGISTITLNKGDLSMGVYFIAVQSSDELLTQKVVLN